MPQSYLISVSSNDIALVQMGLVNLLAYQLCQGWLTNAILITRLCVVYLFNLNAHICNGIVYALYFTYPRM